MTDTAGNEETTQGRHFGRAVKIILVAGAVATALGAIIALGRELWPDPPKPAERLSATISELQVDPKVPLAEYLEETPQAERPSRRTASASGPVFASVSLARSSAPTIASPDRPPRPNSTTTSPQPPPRTPTTPTTPTTPEPPPTTPRPPLADPSSPVDDSSSGAHKPVVTALLAQVEQRPIEDLVQLTTDPSQTDPPRTRMQYVEQIVTDEEDVPADEIRRVLASSRLQISSPPGATPKLSPLGVVVNFSAQIDGFKGKQSVVRWSLFDARERTRMPQSWLRNREALTLIPEAGSDRGSPAVWVPLPRKRGPYFVRLELLDDHGARLDKADTKSFDR